MKCVQACLLWAALTAACSPPPHALIQRESLLGYVDVLAEIRPNAGWRNSASQGEADALQQVQSWLEEMGISALELETFEVPVGAELRESRLLLDGVEVPANAFRGNRLVPWMALRHDTDGELGDTQSDPVHVSGSVVVLGSMEDVLAVDLNALDGAIVFLRYSLIDWSFRQPEDIRSVIQRLYLARFAGLVLVTEWGDTLGESHGAFVGGLPAIEGSAFSPPRPSLYTRLEDLSPAGIHTFDDLRGLERAQLTLDIDILAPAQSANLMATLPGEDSGCAVILGAHIDSPNSPGALDDASGSAILLEIARVLTLSDTTPPCDLHLVWFGAEELGLYGSAHFATTHQELLDRTRGMLQIDGLTRPMSGVEARLALRTWPASRLGEDAVPFQDRLVEAARLRGIDVEGATSYAIWSDNNSFVPWAVPNTELMYLAHDIDAPGGAHYASHVHSPYDTPERVREVAHVFEQMAHVALDAALTAGAAPEPTRVHPAPTRRALIVASHTQASAIPMLHLSDLGIALAAHGFDLDVLPYGRAVKDEELAEVHLVIVLPSLDHATLLAPSKRHDSGWQPEEIDALERYAEQGGLLVLTLSAEVPSFGQPTPNEDGMEDERLTRVFGVRYREVPKAQNPLAVPPRPSGAAGIATLEHPLWDDLSVVVGRSLITQFVLEAEDKKVQPLLLSAEDQTLLAAWIDHGAGQVVVMADYGLLSTSEDSDENLTWVRNLASYAAKRPGTPQHP